MVEIKYKRGIAKHKGKYIIRRTPVPTSNEAWIQLKLGKMYYHGIDTEPDHEKAFIHFKNAAASGIEEATHYLNLMSHSDE